MIRTTRSANAAAASRASDYGTEANCSPRSTAPTSAGANTSVIVNAAILLLMGCLSGACGYASATALYGCFALAALSGVHAQPRPGAARLRHEPLWGVVVAVCCHIGLIARFVLLVLDRNPPWLVRSIYGALALSVTLACASFALARPLLWTSGLGGSAGDQHRVPALCGPRRAVARRRIAGVLMRRACWPSWPARTICCWCEGLFGGAYYTLRRRMRCSSSW